MTENAPGEAFEIRIERWPFVQIPSGLLVDREVNDGSIRTYAILALWGGVDGRAFPSKPKLLQARGCSRSTLFDHLASLQKAGWLLRWEEGDRAVIQLLLRKRRVQESGLDESGNLDGGGPDLRTLKENLEREPERKKTGAPPAAPKPPYKTARDKAKELSKVYPHGTTGGGLRRPPGLKQSTAAILLAERRGHDFLTMLEGAKAYAAAVKGTDDEKFAPAMFRWIKNESWEDALEDAIDSGPTPEQKKADADRNETLNAEQAAAHAKQAAEWALRRAAQVGKESPAKRGTRTPSRRTR